MRQVSDVFDVRWPWLLNFWKTKIGIDVPQGTSKWSANFVSRSQEVTNAQNWRHVYLRATNQAQADPAPTANKTYAIVRPNLLSVVNTWRTATGRTAACHGGTRRRHGFLLYLLYCIFSCKSINQSINHKNQLTHWSDQWFTEEKR